MVSDRDLIGGFFAIDPATIAPSIDSGASERGAIDYSSGRVALGAALDSAGAGGGRILLPDFICESVPKAAHASGYRIEYYRVGPDLLPEQEHLIGLLRHDTDAPVVLLVDYFGLVDTEPVARSIHAEYRHAVLIKDLAQCPWRDGAPTVCAYTFTSWRKAYAVPDGARLRYESERLPSPARGETSVGAQLALAGVLKWVATRVPGVIDESFVALRDEAEFDLDRQFEVRSAQSRYSTRSLLTIDVQDVCRRRRGNFLALREHLAEVGLLPAVELCDGDTPLFYPIRVMDRDQVRAGLAAEGILAPVHWPSSPDSEAMAGAANWQTVGLSLVVDQRYSPDDMLRVADCMKGLGVAPFVY